MGMPQLWQSGSDKDERSSPHLWVHRHPVLESRPNRGDKGEGIAPIAMYYGEIKKNDIANGEGVRVSLFVSGCRNCCPGCFNQETWSFCYGQEFTSATEEEILSALTPVHISGLSVLGGEPFEPENQEVLAPFLQRVREKFPQKNIWCFTGCVLEKDILSPAGRCHTDFTEDMVSSIDVLVDGPFIETEKDLGLQFRGSKNQRIIKAPSRG